jgi:glycosyltransferase involved in cell wall biosynthesis
LVARLKRKRRLMFVTQTHTVWGGMEWWVHHLAQRMTSRGWDVFAGLAQGARFSNPRAYVTAHPHLRPVIMDARAGTESARILAVTRALRQVRPDVVIPIGIGAAFPAMRSFDAAFIVPVLSLHEGVLANVIEYRDVIDLAVPNARLIERVLLRELDPPRVRYIRQGTPRATRQRTPRTARLRVAIVSRLEEASKRVMDLPRVAELLGDEIDLHVFGDGPDAAELTTALRGRAVMHGYMATEQLYREAYPNIDVILLFSATEGSPNVIYEAMQNGVVPVSSRFQGSASEGILRHGENALLFDIGDTESAAQHVKTLAVDSAQLERLSDAARKTNASYTDDDMYTAWMDVIETTPRRARGLMPLALPPSGRMEKAGLSPRAADFLRRLFGVHFPHRSGWEEWPGSQWADGKTTAQIQDQMSEIERKANGER